MLNSTGKKKFQQRFTNSTDSRYRQFHPHGEQARPGGLPGFDHTITPWEKESGLSSQHYHYYSVFAGMRYSLIMSRVMLATGQPEQIADNFVLSLLQKIIDKN
jgi:hypothetical protein